MPAGLLSVKLTLLFFGETLAGAKVTLLFSGETLLWGGREPCWGILRLRPLPDALGKLPKRHALPARSVKERERGPGGVGLQMGR